MYVHADTYVLTYAGVAVCMYFCGCHPDSGLTGASHLPRMASPSRPPALVNATSENFLQGRGLDMPDHDHSRYDDCLSLQKR